MSRAVAVVLGVAAAGFVMAAAYWLMTPRLERLAPFADAEYLRAAERSAEGQAFLAKYPGAAESVERTAAVVVDLGVERAGHALHLRFYMDAFEDRVLETFAYCDGRQHGDVVAYLETERCLAP